MFLEPMAPPRSEFFKYDVIFLGDMPRSALSNRFCELAREFVRDFVYYCQRAILTAFRKESVHSTPLGEY